MLELAETPFRYHEFLYEQWNKLRGAHPFAQMKDMDMAALAKIADFCFLVELGSRKGNVGYSYVQRGAAISQTQGEDAEVVEFLFSNPRTPLDLLLNQVEISAKPVTESSEFITSNNKIIRYRRCLLPLGDGSGHVGYVIGCVRWKAFDAAEKKAEAKFSWEDPKVK